MDELPDDLTSTLGGDGLSIKNSSSLLDLFSGSELISSSNSSSEYSSLSDFADGIFGLDGYKFGLGSAGGVGYRIDFGFSTGGDGIFAFTGGDGGSESDELSTAISGTLSLL